MARMRIGSNIADRLTTLAQAVLVIVIRLPVDAATRGHITKQLVRAVTATGANYAEARAAESRADFIHKLGLAAKEARETIYWLEVVRADTSDSESQARLDRMIDEAQQLAAILFASRRTALQNAATG